MNQQILFDEKCPKKTFNDAHENLWYFNTMARKYVITLVNSFDCHLYEFAYVLNCVKTIKRRQTEMARLHIFLRILL